MKAVLFDKRKYSWKDIAKVSFIFLGHYFFFIFYVGMILGIKWAMYKEPFFPTIDFKNWLLYYPVTLAPIVSGSLHIIYAEKGSPWFRFAMWLHGMVNIILVPIIALT